MGDTPLEAEVTADDEAGAKESAVAATLEKLKLEGVDAEAPATVNWNAVVTQRFNKHS